MVIKICEHCKSEYYIKPSCQEGSRFCSYSCYVDHHIQKRLANIQHDDCHYCDINYEVKYKNQKFCSKSCRTSYLNNVRLGLDPKFRHDKKKVQNICRRCKTKKTKPCSQLCDSCLETIHFSKCSVCNSYFNKEKFKRRICSECQTKFENMTEEDKLKILESKSSHPSTKIYWCKGCRKAHTEHKRQYCGDCKTNPRHYRSLCSFKFNVFEYPNEFELNLVKIYGWFSPNGYKRRNKTPNLNGVSRDHLYTVSDGFENNRDPKILSRPANCRLMVHNGPDGNNSKKNSSITWNELLERIEIWNSKYGPYNP